MKASVSAQAIRNKGWQYSFLVFLTASLIGCASRPGSKPPSEAVVKARQEIAQNRESVTVLVPRIKAKLKGKEAGRDYIRAQKLYDSAMVQNNSWVTSLKLAVENNEDLEKSQSFKDKAKAAGDATERFIKFGRQLTQGKASASVKAFPGFTVGDFVTALVENAIVIWKEFKDEEKKDRLDQAARIEKELRWAKWEEVK